MSGKSEILNEFREQCAALSKETMPNSGLIYELYQRRLSDRIDYFLNDVPSEHREDALKLAREEFDYLTPEEIAEEIQRDRENGMCSHGIERDCCPLGCGDWDE
ncbi:CcgAII protein [Escherichia coli]|nr:CcgAII protein [Salmonella enterica subsp. enterica serovar Typhimurium]EGM8680964.1 CcgAII protein [Escherichia coli]